MSESETATDIDRLKARIDQIAREGGSQLPPEPRLAELVGVSRGRLRTLLGRLEKEGSIWRHVGKGTFIGPRDLARAPASWHDGISVAEIMEARLVFEPQLAAQAAICARPVDVGRMEACIGEMNSAGSYVQWKRQDEILHRLIAEATHNGLLLLLYDTFRARGRSELEARLADVFGTDGVPPTETDSQHEAIVAAISRANPEAAAQAMRQHIAHVRDRLFSLR